MALENDVVLVAGSSALPLSYEVPNSQEIVPLTVTATFDGTSASGNWTPTLEIVSDGGVVIARVPVSTTLAAGATAEATWAPFLRAATTGDGGSPVGGGLTDPTTGYIVESFPAAQITTAPALIVNNSGHQFVAMLMPYAIPAGTTITGCVVTYITQTLPVKANAGVFQVGIADATTKTVLAVSVDDFAALANANTTARLPVPFPAPYVTATRSSLYAFIYASAISSGGQVAFSAMSGSAAGSIAVPGFAQPRDTWVDPSAPLGGIAAGYTLGFLSSISTNVWWIALY